MKLLLSTCLLTSIVFSSGVFAAERYVSCWSHKGAPVYDYLVGLTSSGYTNEISLAYNQNDDGTYEVQLRDEKDVVCKSYGNYPVGHPKSGEPITRCKNMIPAKTFISAQPSESGFSISAGRSTISLDQATKKHPRLTVEGTRFKCSDISKESFENSTASAWN